MTLYLSFEQEAMIADLPNNPHNAREDVLDHGFITIADNELYDGPGAKHPPGNILATIGPIPNQYAENATNQLAQFLRSLYLGVKVHGVDF